MKLDKTVSKNELFALLKGMCKPIIALNGYTVQGVPIIETNKEYFYKGTNNEQKIIIDDNLKKIELTYDEFNFIFNFDINEYDKLWSGNKQIYAKLLYEDVNYCLQVPKEFRDKIISDYEKYLQNKIIFDAFIEDIDNQLKELDKKEKKLLSQRTKKYTEFEKNNQIFEDYYDFDDISSPF